MLIKERPENWQPPQRYYGGEDLVEYFTLMLVDETVAMICVKSGQFDLPIAAGIDSVLDQKKAISGRLKDNNQFFYLPNWSIFMDYKSMRGDAQFKLGQQITEPGHDSLDAYFLAAAALRESFDPQMSTAEAIALARAIVALWDWSEPEQPEATSTTQPIEPNPTTDQGKATSKPDGQLDQS
jgi:hypothetical protein